MDLLKKLISSAIITAGLTIATLSVSEQNQEPVYFHRLFQKGMIESWYYGKGPHNGFKFDLIKHLRTCYFLGKTEETLAFYDSETGKWIEFSNGTKKIILNSIEELKKYTTEQFMKCEETI